MDITGIEIIMSTEKITWKYTIKCIASSIIGTLIIAVPSTIMVYRSYIKAPEGKEHVYVKQKSGEKIKTDNWFFTSDFGGFDVIAEGKGEAEVKFMRPAKWRLKKHRIIVNLNVALTPDAFSYGAGLNYYYMLFDYVGVGGGINVTANESGYYNIGVQAGALFSF